MIEKTKFDSKNIQLILIGVSFFYLLIGSNIGLNIYDEAIGVYGAELVSNGKLPYKDFWTLYAPGHFYLLAGWTSVFGQSIMAERIFSVLIPS